MDRHCWYTLDIDVSSALLDSWRWPVLAANSVGVYNKHPASVFTRKWLSTMSSIGLPVSDLMLFDKPAGYVNDRAHVDTVARDMAELQVFAVNWVIGGTGSTMSWYSASNTQPHVAYTSTGIPYASWPLSELIEIERTNISLAPTLVRTDIPHAITVSNESRKCISVRFNTPATDWNSVVALLHDKQLLLPR